MRALSSIRVERLQYEILPLRLRAGWMRSAVLSSLESITTGMSLKSDTFPFRWYQEFIAAHVGHVNVGNDKVGDITFVKPLKSL